MADNLDVKLRALEDEIFYQVDLKLAEQLRAETLHEEKREQLSKLMDHAKCVAEASNSFLSFKRINPQKQQALDRLREVLQSE